MPDTPAEHSTLEDDVEDPLEQMLKKTGCINLHYQVQECIAETKDWRKCQEEVKVFRNCMVEHAKRNAPH